jgi:hypothetical protein
VFAFLRVGARRTGRRGRADRGRRADQ